MNGSCKLKRGLAAIGLLGGISELALYSTGNCPIRNTAWAIAAGVLLLLVLGLGYAAFVGVRCLTEIDRAIQDGAATSPISEGVYLQLRKLAAGSFGGYRLDPNPAIGLADELKHLRSVGYIRFKRPAGLAEIPVGDHEDADLSEYVEITAGGKAFVAARGGALHKADSVPFDKRPELTEHERSYLQAEYSVLNRQIDLRLKQIETNERLALVGTGAIWSWLATHQWNPTYAIVGFAPAAICYLFFLKWRALEQSLERNARYISEIEKSVAPEGFGWETRLCRGPRTWFKHYHVLFWGLLVAANLVLAWYSRGHHQEFTTEGDKPDTALQPNAQNGAAPRWVPAAGGSLR